MYLVEEGLYYPCSENKGTDLLPSYCEADLRLCFRLCRLLVFPCSSSIYLLFFSGQKLLSVILFKSYQGLKFYFFQSNLYIYCINLRTLHARYRTSCNLRFHQGEKNVHVSCLSLLPFYVWDYRILQYEIYKTSLRGV